MSTYHKWRTVFVQIPKNASSSIHRALSNQTDDSHDHETYISILANNDPELIESYYSFAVVRNPYDRFVSAYEWVRQNSGWPLSFEETVEQWYNRGSFFYTTEDVAWWPQHRYTCIKNIVLVDKVIKYEDLESGWTEIVDNINNRLPESFSQPPSNLPYENKTSFRENRDWHEYYTQELADKVYSLYKKDFQMFEYEKLSL